MCSCDSSDAAGSAVAALQCQAGSDRVGLQVRCDACMVGCQESHVLSHDAGLQSRMRTCKHPGEGVQAGRCAFLVGEYQRVPMSSALYHGILRACSKGG